MNDTNIVDTIIQLMENVEHIIDLKNGVDKKAYVLRSLKSIIGDDSYERYYFFIESFIDFTCAINKGDRKVNVNNHTLLRKLHKKLNCC